MKRLIAKISIVILSLVGLAIPSIPASATPVTIEASTSKLEPSNTSRKIVVASNGDIFVLYSGGSTGVYVARSSDNGASFAAGVLVDATSDEAELAISNSGTLFVTWADGSKIYQKRSTDSGATWGSAVEVATYESFSVHTAVDREYVYAISRDGQRVFSSADSGDVWREAVSSDNDWAYSDVQVDPLTGRVYTFVDDPSVSWYYSDDRGLTFSDQQETGKEVFYSVSAISSSPSAKYLFMVGGAAGDPSASSSLVRLNLATGAVTSFESLSQIETSDTRSIAADSMGNIVVGGVDGDDFFFQVSNDSGATFGSNQSVQAGIGNDYGAVTINPTNGDVLALWEDSGAIKFQTFPGLLVGYDLNLDVTALDFDGAGNKGIILTNTSASAITVSEISLSNSTDFSETNDCSAALSQNDTCTITVTATSEGSAILTIKASGGIERFIPIAFGTSAATLDLPEVTEESSTPAAAPYTGPIVNPLPSQVAAGSKVVLSGSNLSSVSAASIDGKDALVRVISDLELEITVPAGLAGLFDLVVVADNGTLTVQSAINIAGDASVSTGAGTKRTGDSFRIYYFDPVNKGKVQFFVNGKEIAWVNATTDTDPKLRSTIKDGLETNYLVRELDLTDGKNIIEVFVDGERVKRVAYTLK